MLISASTCIPSGTFYVAENTFVYIFWY